MPAQPCRRLRGLSDLGSGVSTQGEAARRLRHTCEYERRVRFHLIDGSLAHGREHGVSDHRLLPRARAVLCLKF